MKRMNTLPKIHNFYLLYVLRVLLCCSYKNLQEKQTMGRTDKERKKFISWGSGASNFLSCGRRGTRKTEGTKSFRR